MVSTRPLIFKSSSPWFNPLLTVLSAPITIGITNHIHVARLFSIPWQCRGTFFYNSFSVNLTQRSAVTGKSTIRQVFFFLVIRPGRLAEIRWSVCILKSQRNLCVSFARTNTEMCIYHLLEWAFIIIIIIIIIIITALIMIIIIYLCSSKSPQVSRSVFGILPDFNNAVVWIVSIRPQIFNSFTNVRVSFHAPQFQLV